MRALLFVFMIGQVGSMDADKAELSVLAGNVLDLISRQDLKGLREVSVSQISYGPVCSDLISKTGVSSKTFEKLVADVRQKAAALSGELKHGKTKLVFSKLTKRGQAQLTDRQHRFTLEFRKAKNERWKLSGVFIGTQNNQVKKNFRKNISSPFGPTKLASESEAGEQTVILATAEDTDDEDSL